MNLFVEKYEKKEVVINQFFGLGDILFIEPIYRYYHDRGFKVIAPVLKKYLWIQEYIDYVEFKEKETYTYSYETVEQAEDGRLHVPLRFAHPLYRGYSDLHSGERKNWMRDKYLYLGMDEFKYKEFKWTRNERENELVKLLNLPEKYNFVNEFWGESYEKVTITRLNDLRNVYMRKIEGFTMLDWAKVIEGASNIFTVETSVVWMIEALETQGELHLYPRYPALDDLSYFEGQLTKNWVFHDKTNL